MNWKKEFWNSARKLKVPYAATAGGSRSKKGVCQGVKWRYRMQQYERIYSELVAVSKHFDLSACD
jgi:hypothetical protein